MKLTPFKRFLLIISLVVSLCGGCGHKIPEVKTVEQSESTESELKLKDFGCSYPLTDGVISLETRKVDSDKFYEWLKRFPCYSQIRGYFESNEWEPYLGTVILDGKTYWAVFTQPKRYILLDDNTGYIPPMS